MRAVATDASAEITGQIPSHAEQDHSSINMPFLERATLRHSTDGAVAQTLRQTIRNRWGEQGPRSKVSHPAWAANSAIDTWLPWDQHSCQGAPLG